MREIMENLLEVVHRDGAAALATVVRTWSSAPRPAGASMLVTDTGEAVGSVSGGCVEGAVYAVGEEVLADGVGRYESYGVSQDDAFSVGLTCGGQLDVFVERVDRETWPELEGVARDVALGEPLAVATVVGGSAFVGRHMIVRAESAEGSLGSDRLDAAVRADALGMLQSGTTGVLCYGQDGERLEEGLDVFVTTFAPPPRLFVFGAIDFSRALVRVAKVLGFRVTVCDARPVFATSKRFPEADEVVAAWPHRWLAGQEVDRRTAIAVLTHDPKFDVPVLEVALRSEAGYVGAMGSRKTHEDRLDRLRAIGMTEAELTLLHSPIGIDIGARTPEETAVSIMAEMVQVRWGGTGQQLNATSGPIHQGSSLQVHAPEGR